MNAQTKRDKPPVSPRGKETRYSKNIANGTAIIPETKADIKAKHGSGWLSSFNQNQSHKREGRNPPAMAKSKVEIVKFAAIVL